MSLDEYLKNNNVKMVGGHSGQVPEQTEYLKNCAKRLKDNALIMEIGFNAGHSCNTILSVNPTFKMVSFDHGVRESVLAGKNYIDNTYPFRHRLILGDSRETVPNFIRYNPTTKFDLIFVDGGHHISVVTSDIENALKLSHQDTVVLVDDVVRRPDWARVWTVDPTRAWGNFVKDGRVREVEQVDFCGGRGVAHGVKNIISSLNIK